MSTFKKAFLAGLIVIYWGKIVIDLSQSISISTGGTTNSVMVPLFLLYLIVKAQRGERTLPVRLLSPLIIFTLYCFISILWTRGHDSYFFNTVLLPSFLGYLIFYDLMMSDAEFLQEKFLPVFTIGAILMIVRGIMDAPGPLVNEGKLDTPAEHHTLLSMNLVFMLPLVMAMFARDEKRKLFYGICLVFIILGVVICGSRVGLVVLFMELVFFVFRFAGQKMRIIGAAAIIISILFLFTFPMTHQRFVGLLSLGNDPYMITRTRIWDMTLAFTKDHLPLGLGFSQKAFRAEGVERYGEELFFYEHPHNIYLQILSYLGIVGLGIFLWFCVDMVKKLAFLRKGSHSFLAECMVAGFAGLLITNLVEGALNSGRVMLNIFFICALIDLYYMQEHDSGQET